MAQMTTNASFEQDVLKSSNPVIVDFMASWCGPCRALSPVLDSLAKEWEGKASIVKVDADDEDVLVSKYSVQSLPTLVIFKDGKEVERLVGLRSKSEIADKVNGYV